MLYGRLMRLAAVMIVATSALTLGCGEQTDAAERQAAKLEERLETQITASLPGLGRAVTRCTPVDEELDAFRCDTSAYERNGTLLCRVPIDIVLDTDDETYVWTEPRC